MKIRVKLSAKEAENVDVLNTEDVEKNKEIEALLDRFEKKAAEMPDGVLASYQEWDDFSEAAIVEKHREELVEQAESLEHIYESVAKKSYRASHWRSMAVYMLVVTTMASCVTFSKFITEVSGAGSGTVASFDFQVASPGLLQVEENQVFFGGYLASEEYQEYTFTVTNNSDVTVFGTATITGSTNVQIVGGSNNGTEASATFAPGDSVSFTVKITSPSTDGTVESATLTVVGQQVD